MEKGFGQEEQSEKEKLESIAFAGKNISVDLSCGTASFVSGALGLVNGALLPLPAFVEHHQYRHHPDSVQVQKPSAL